MTREFDFLRALQRMLRLYEEQHGPNCGVFKLRQVVLRKMAALAAATALCFIAGAGG